MIIHPGKGNPLSLILLEMGDEIDDPYVREVPIEKFIDEMEKASEEQESDEEE